MSDDVKVTRSTTEEHVSSVVYKPGSLPALVVEHALLAATQELLKLYPDGHLAFDRQTHSYVVNAIGERCSWLMVEIEMQQRHATLFAAQRGAAEETT